MKTKFNLLAILAVLGLFTITSCEKEETEPDKTNTPVTPTDTTNNNNPSALSSNTFKIGNETIRVMNVGFASGQSAATFTSNNSDLKDIRLFWNGTDTQNGLNVPNDGIYTLIESTSGFVANAGEVNMRINVNSSVFSFYMSSTVGGTVEIKTINGFTHYIFNNVELKQYTSFGSPLTPSNITVSANLGGDPKAGISNSTLANNMEYVINNTTTAITSAKIKSGYIDINNGEMYIYFKNSGVPAPGDYKIMGSLQNVFAYDSGHITNNDECLIAYYKDQYYSIISGVKMTVSLVNGKTNLVFKDALVNASSKDEAPYFPLSLNADAVQ